MTAFGDYYTWMKWQDWNLPELPLPAYLFFLLSVTEFCHAAELARAKLQPCGDLAWHQVSRR